MRYPVFIPSLGRPTKCSSAEALPEAKIVVEPHEADAYAEIHEADRLLVLPFENQGCASPARNWIKHHAAKAGHRRHWQLDDNILAWFRYQAGKREKADPAELMGQAEDFVDRYENVALAGFKNTAFGFQEKQPISLNRQVYCCILVSSVMPFEWRGGGCADTDMSLQVLVAGWCTVLFNVFQIRKPPSMSMSGGNTDTVYAKSGQLERARLLESRWPGLVKLGRKHGQPQQELGQVWRRFTTRLVRCA